MRVYMLAKASKMAAASDIAAAIARIVRAWKDGAAQPGDPLQLFRRWAEESVVALAAALERQEMSEHDKKAQRPSGRSCRDTKTAFVSAVADRPPLLGTRCRRSPSASWRRSAGIPLGARAVPTGPREVLASHAAAGRGTVGLARRADTLACSGLSGQHTGARRAPIRMVGRRSGYCPRLVGCGCQADARRRRHADRALPQCDNHDPPGGDSRGCGARRLQRRCPLPDCADVGREQAHHAACQLVCGDGGVGDRCDAAAVVRGSQVGALKSAFLDSTEHARRRTFERGGWSLLRPSRAMCAGGFSVRLTRCG